MAVSVAVCEIFSVIFANMLDTHKTRMTRLPCGEETMTICLAVFIKYRNVTDRQTDGQNCYIDIARQYADARYKCRI